MGQATHPMSRTGMSRGVDSLTACSARSTSQLLTGSGSMLSRPSTRRTAEAGRERAAGDPKRTQPRARSCVVAARISSLPPSTAKCNASLAMSTGQVTLAQERPKSETKGAYALPRCHARARSPSIGFSASTGRLGGAAPGGCRGEDAVWRSSARVSWKRESRWGSLPCVVPRTSLTTRTTCRICGSPELVSVLSLGEQYIAGAFAEPGAEQPVSRRIPLELVRCDMTRNEEGCGLVQLRHTVPGAILYGSYWYRSGVNQTMTRNLHEIAAP